MDTIIGVFGKVPDTAGQNDDDFADRLSHKYSTILCILFAIIVSSKQYVGEPITCWVPAHFTGNHVTYVDNYCWIKNTYYLPFSREIPKEEEDEKRQMIPYYQWMPLILLVQALLFYMPILVWRSIGSAAGINIDSIIDAGAIHEAVDDKEIQSKTLTNMVKQTDRYLMNQQENLATSCTISLKHVLSRTVCRCCGRREGNYLTVLYIATKILFLGGVIGQLFLLNFLLGTNYNMYGIDVMRSLFQTNDGTWEPSPTFPRVTMCNFFVRRLGNLQRYTVQCVLPINLFNEKIFLFMWFWMVFLAIVLSYSLISWILRSAFRTDRKRFIKKHLVMAGKNKKNSDKEKLKPFVEDYLRSDGVFLLRLFGKNRHGSTTTEFIGALWDNYIKTGGGDKLPDVMIGSDHSMASMGGANFKKTS